MLIKSIEFVTDLENIADPKNDNIDVWLELENGFTYNLVVATPANIVSLMEKEELNYFSTGYPFILVKELTYDIIKETLKSYADENNGYWLKLYHFAGAIPENVFQALETEVMKDLK